MPLAAGTRLGPYEILVPLGAGGMGEVYRARDTRLGREVAIKVLPQHLSSSPELRARFEREAKTISSLNHPHICVLHDIGRAPGDPGAGDIDFLVMELVEGETLATRLEKGPLPIPEVLRIGIELAGALSRAHRAGVIHRDLKPGNVMLTRSGAKLMDFGLARATGLAGPADGSGVTAEALTQSPTVTHPLTAEGTIVGTFQYLSPEQLEGRDADVRSDIWALGCVLYEMATGRRAFEGESQASLMAAILGREPVPIATVEPMSPAALDRLVRAMLAKDPDDRVQTAQDAKLQLEWIQAEGVSSSAAPAGAASASTAGGSPARRMRWALPVLALVVAAASFFGGRWSARPPDEVPVEFVRKTFRPQFILNARFMPDGKTLVLSAALEGNVPHLYVIRPEYPEPRPLQGANMHLLAVSSRGELLVLNHARFIEQRLCEGTLARMPLDGGAPREIMKDVREADWSPDGKDIAVIHQVAGKDRLEFPVGKVLYEAGGYLSDVRVSPKGDLIAFMEHPKRFDDRGSVKVVDLAGKARVLSDGWWGLEGLAWSPDGRSVAFGGWNGSASDYLMREVDLAGRLRPVRHNVGPAIVLDIAANGTWAVARYEIPMRIGFRPAGSKEEIDLSWLDNSDGAIVSEDGKTVAFTDESIEAGPDYAVGLRPSSGGPITRLGPGSAMQFSPDGKSLLVHVLSTPPRLMSYPLGPGETTRLDHGGLENIATAQWMPDGRRVLLCGNEAGKPTRCYLLDPSAGHLAPVGPEGVRSAFPAPDGKSFVGQGPSGWAIFALSGTGEGRRVPAMRPGEDMIRWSPDGAAVYCYSKSEVPCHVDRIDLASGRRENVAVLADPPAPGLIGFYNVSMAGDLRSIAYSTMNNSSVLYTLKRAK